MEEPGTDKDSKLAEVRDYILSNENDWIEELPKHDSSDAEKSGLTRSKMELLLEA